MIYPLTGRYQHYSWGGFTFISDFTGNSFPDQQPVAEYWLGAHFSAPAMVQTEPEQPLDHFLQENPFVLGQESCEKFGNQLPFLLKILDVNQPLSIQLHPTKSQAEQGFDQENLCGIPLNAPTRIYKDRNHKPEMMIALSDFWLLHGFQSKEKIRALFQTRPSLHSLMPMLERESMHEFYQRVMLASQEDLAGWLLPIVDSYQNCPLPNPDNPDYWLLYSMEAMAISREKLDAGLLCFYLFNLVHLRQGEGIFQAAGIPHTYLRGQNIELMSASDNVIRGGLTPKHVDISELLKIVDCREIEPQIIAPASDFHRYPTPATDFALTHQSFQPQQIGENHAQNAKILLVMAGSITLYYDTQYLRLHKGQAVFIEAGTKYHFQGLETGYFVEASVSP